MIKEKLDDIFNEYDKHDPYSLLTITKDIDMFLDDELTTDNYNIEYTDNILVVAWREVGVGVEIAIYEL